MEDLEVWRKYIKKSFWEICSDNFLTTSELADELNFGNITNKNHIFSINDRIIYYLVLMCKCQKCGLLCSFFLDRDDKIIVFNETALSCDENIIKNIIE